jgi:hypothetical protein
MNVKKTIALCLSIVVSYTCHAMEVPPRIQIIDANKGQSIKEVVGSDPLNIGVFGATPRYSYFEQYKQTVQTCTQELLLQHEAESSKCKKEPTRLKGVEKRICNLLFALRKQPGLKVVEHDFAHFSEKEYMQLFFNAGFKEEDLKQNVETLVRTAQTCLEKQRSNICTQKCLVHIFVPSYFSDLAHLKSMQEAPHMLYLFLKQAALHYQHLYERTAFDPDIRICILIPPIAYFTAMLQSNSSDKATTNITVVHEEVIKRVSSNCQFTLFDQNPNDRKAMATCLEHAHIENATLYTLALATLSRQGTPIFTPYLLIPQNNVDSDKKKHDYKTSPLFNQRLVAFIQQKHAGGSHE